MKPIEIISIGLRITGIYFLFLVFMQLPFIAQAFIDSFSGNFPLSTRFYTGFASIAVKMIASILLIKFPATICRAILTSTPLSEDQIELPTMRQIEVSSIIICGVFIFSEYLPNFVLDVLLQITHQTVNTRPGSSITYAHYAFVDLIAMIFGVLLSTQAYKLSSYLHGVKNQ